MIIIYKNRRKKSVRLFILGTADISIFWQRIPTKRSLKYYYCNELIVAETYEFFEVKSKSIVRVYFLFYKH
jgi:hypothetical protein